MKIPIDQEINASTGAVEATHYLDLDTPISLAHPDGSGEPVDMNGFLKYYIRNPEKREQAGYNIRRQLPGEDKPYSRWERIVKAILASKEHEALRKEIESQADGKSEQPAHGRSLKPDK